MSNKIMKTIIKLSHTKARDFFLNQKRYCNVDLPNYFNFQPLLDALSEKITSNNFQTLCEKAKKHYDVNHTIFCNKNGKFSWRPLQLINPAIYVFLVHKITEKNNWEFIIKRFKSFRTNKIECCSMPFLLREGKETNKGSIVTNWWENIEQKSLELSLKYDYLLDTDITDCYGSIYTHTISWALHGKEFAKKNHTYKDKEKYIGNCIDDIIQSMQYGQTNGIPQGSDLMDFIAEMILGYADLLLSEKIKKERIRDYKILRYRDDYRIFTNSQEDGVMIAKLLTEILIDLNLKLNPNKTSVSDDIIQAAIKPDKLFWLTSKQRVKNLQKSLLLIHLLAKKYPNSGSVTKALSDFQKRIFKRQKFDKENIKVLISIVVDIMYKNPKTYPMAVAILSKFLSLLNNNKEINKIIVDIGKKFKKIPNVGNLQIWLQRMTLKINKNKEYDEKLCKKIIDNNTQIWNIDWLKNEAIKEIFSKKPIIDRKYILNMEPIINSIEIQLYNNSYSY